MTGDAATLIAECQALATAMIPIEAATVVVVTQAPCPGCVRLTTGNAKRLTVVDLPPPAARILAARLYPAFARTAYSRN